MEKQRVIVYVDGFNFYYGLKKDRRWKRYYWLDVVHLKAQDFDLTIPVKWQAFQP